MGVVLANIKGTKYVIEFRETSVTFRNADTGKIKMVAPIRAKLTDILKAW